MSSLGIYPSGAKKRGKKKQLEELVKSESGSLFRYFKKPKSLSTDEVNEADDHDDNGGIDENLRLMELTRLMELMMMRLLG